MVVQASTRTRSVFGQREDNETHLTEKADRRSVNPYCMERVKSERMPSHPTDPVEGQT